MRPTFAFLGPTQTSTFPPDGSMWGVISGILGVSVVLALAETLYKDVRNRPGPVEKLEGKDYVPPSSKKSQYYSGPAKDIFNQAKKLRK